MISESFNYTTLQTVDFIFQWPNWFRNYELDLSGFQWGVAFPQAKHLWWWGPWSAQAQHSQHWVCQCFSRLSPAWPGTWSMECPDLGQAGTAFLAQMFWLHSFGNQLVHAALWDKADLMHPDLGRSAAPLGGCFWHKSGHIFMCSFGKGSKYSKVIVMLTFA